MYKKYITKKGKKVGPYYYDSIRLKEGKVKSVYLGADIKKAKQRLKVLKKESSKAVHKRSSATLKKSLNPRASVRVNADHQVHMKDRIFLSFVLILMLIGFMHFGGILNDGPSNSVSGGFVTGFRTFSDIARDSFLEENLITGNVVFSKENKITGDAIFSSAVPDVEHEHNVSLLVSESSEYGLSFEGVEKLTSLKLSGRIATFEEGIVKVFLSDAESGDTYLVYDSVAVEGGILSAVGITGSVVLEGIEEVVEEKPKSYKDIVSSLTGFNVVDSKGRRVKYEISNGSNGTSIIDLDEKDLFEIEYPQGEGWIAYEKYSSRGLIEPTNISFERVFGFDFSGLNISEFNETNTSFSTVPEGSYLYGCSFWDFELGICLSDWVYLFDINNTENYTVNLRAEVMAFAEGIFDLKLKKEVEEEVVGREEVEAEKEDFLISLLEILNITTYDIDSFESECEDTCKMKNVRSNNFILKVYIQDSVLELSSIDVGYNALEEEVYSLSILNGNSNIILDGVDSPSGDVVDNYIGGSVEVLNGSNYTEETIQFGAVIGKPVKWKKKIVLNAAMKGVEFEIPDVAENITLKKVVDGETLDVTSAGLDEGNGTIVNLTGDPRNGGSFTENFLNSITGNAITGMVVTDVPLVGNISSGQIPDENITGGNNIVLVDDLVDIVEVEYETPGPTLEIQNRSGGFRAVLKSDLNYTNILAFLDIPETPMNKVKLFRIVADNSTGKESRFEHNFTLYGSNNSGLANYIEWTIPTSEDDTFDIQTEINATAAIHLDENYVYINDIFDEVRFVDAIWSETIFKDEYVRVTFERNLTNGRMIDVLARSNGSLSYFEIYEANTTNLVGTSAIVEYPEVQYILVDGLSKPTDVFDFKFFNLNGSMEDYNNCIKWGYADCDNNPYEGCYKDVEDSCDSPMFDLNRTAFMEFDFIHDDVINSTQADGLVVYGESGSTNPRYRIWNESDDFEAEQSASSIGGVAPAWIVTKGSHERNEIIMAASDAAFDLNIQVYNGAAWNNLTEITATMDAVNQRSFDIEYEDISGDALIVYENSDAATNADFAYRTWDGTSVSSESTFTTLLGNDEIWWVKLAHEPGSDKIMVLVMNQQQDLYAVEWDGTTFDTATDIILNTITSGISQHFEFAYEATTLGEGIVLYGADTNAIFRRFKSGTGWTAESPTALGQALRNVRLCPDPSSDYIGLILEDAGADVNVDIWTGTAMLGGAPTQDAFVELSGVYNANVGCFWMNSSTAVFGFVDGNALAIDWVTYSKVGGWSTSALTSTSTTSNFATDDIGSIRFVKHPTTEEALVITEDIAEDIYAIRWNAVTVSLPPHNLLEAVASQTDGHVELAMFDWFRYDPVPNVTDLKPNGENFSISDTVLINATILDNLVVDTVLANVTYPNETVVEIVLTVGDGSDTYAGSFTGTDKAGTYNVTIIANDTSTHQNINSTEKTDFNVTPAAPDQPPTVTLVGPDNGTVYTEVGTIVLNATVDDPEDSTLTVRIYGNNGTTLGDLDLDDLIYYNESDVNATGADYNWTAPVLNATSEYLLLAHLDNNSFDFGESHDSIFDFGYADGVQNGSIIGTGVIDMSNGKLAGAYSSNAGGGTNRIDFGDQDTWIDSGNISYLFWVKSGDISQTIGGIFGKSIIDLLDVDLGMNVVQATTSLRITIGEEVFNIVGFFGDNDWHHVGIVFNASNGFTVYTDGESNSTFGFETLLANNQAFVIGNRFTSVAYDKPFNGYVDEFAIINRSLTAQEVADAYKLKSGNHTWYYKVNDSGGNTVSSDSQYFTIDRKPNITSISIGPTGANRTSGLNCTFTPIDDLDTTVDATVKYYNMSNLLKTNSPTGLTSNVSFTDNLSAFTYEHFENYSCNVTVTDDQASVSDQLDSLYVFIENYEPGTAVLNSPYNTTTHTNRTPTFNWTPSDEFNRLPGVGNTTCASEGLFFCQSRTSDPDQDQVNYTLNLSCFVTTGGTCDDEREYNVVENATNCDANANGYLDNEDNCTFVLPTDLIYFYDDNRYYEWTVKSLDPYVQEENLPTTSEYNLSVLVALDLLNSTVDFGTLGLRVRSETSGCNLASQTPTPCPIWIENSGNVKADVNITGPTVAFWNTQSIPHDLDYFGVKVGAGTEGVSFDTEDSNITYTTMPGSGVSRKYINNLSKTDSADEARIDFNISVPDEELSGARGIILELTTWYGEVGGG